MYASCTPDDGELTREQLHEAGIPTTPEVLVGGLGVEGLEVRESGHGRGERTVVFLLDPGAGGRGEDGTLVRVDPAVLVAACEGCDVTLSRGEDVLARTDAATLELREHDGRLRVWARLAPTAVAADVAVALDRGDLDVAGVELVAAESRFTRDGDTITRHVLEAASVSAVRLGGVEHGRASGSALAAARRRARAALASHARPGRS